MAITGAIAIGAIAAPIIAGAIGNMNSSAQRAAAAAAAQNAVDAITSVGAGPDLARQIYMQEFQKAGVLTPEIEQSINAGVSKVSQIQEDPNLKNAQTNALSMLQQRATSGISPQDRANLNKIQQDSAAQAEGQRQAILQQFAQRGQGGSGSELLAALTSGQNATNNASNQSINVAGQASQNALNALGQYANQASSIRGQDFSNAQAKAQAADEMNRFNVGNQVSQQARNVAAQNAGQQFNLQNAQNISNSNTQQANNELLRQRQAEQQQYLNKMQQAVAEANAYNGQGTNLNNQAAATGQMYAGIGQGVGQGLSAIGGAKQGTLFNPTPTDNTVEEE